MLAPKNKKTIKNKLVFDDFNGRPHEIEVEPCHVEPDPVKVEKVESILAALPKIKEIVTIIESVPETPSPPSV